jgi:CRP-like cAMP-binding protein
MSTAPTHPIHPANAFNVARADRSTLFELGAERKWARHQTLFTAGKPVASVHRVVSGLLARSIALSKGRRQIVDILLPGDTCGFFQSGGGHLFDCEAITEATTCAIDASHLRKLRIGCPDVGKAIDEELVFAVKCMAEHLVTVGKLSATERLLSCIGWRQPIRNEAYPRTRSRFR